MNAQEIESGIFDRRRGVAVVYSPEVEYVGKVPGLEGVTQIIFKFPDDPRLEGEVWVRIDFLGSFSNKARLTIRPQQ